MSSENGVGARRLVIALALAAIVLGIVARFDSLDRKVLWFDESFSLLRISGHSQSALYALFDGKVHPSGALLALQHVTPDRGPGTTLASLREEPQRGPLYYLLARLWIGVSGNATAAVRGLSVAFGIAGIGLGFLLGRRLTKSVEGGCVLAALIALSPLEIRFSQQVREYVLVADLTLLSAFLLLRAFEKPAWARWLAYGACLACGLYTNVTFAFLIIGEGLVVLWIGLRERQRARFHATGFFAAVAGAVLLYAPWEYEAAKIAAQHSIDIAWAAGSYPVRATMLKWAFNAGAVFFDSEYAHVTWGVVLLPLLALVAVGAAAAFVRATRHVERDVALASVLALTLTFSTLVPIVALDLLHHAHYELVARYQMPTWLGLSVLVALLVAPALRSTAARSRALAGCTLTLVLVAGAASAFFDRSYAEWWDNNDHLSERAVGDLVGAGPQPALVVASDAADDAYDTFVLSRYLAPATPLLLFGDRLPPLPGGFSVTYFFTPSRAELLQVAARTGVAPRNVSPSAGLSVPELNAARTSGTETVLANNALWEIGAVDTLDSVLVVKH